MHYQLTALAATITIVPLWLGIAFGGWFIFPLVIIRAISVIVEAQSGAHMLFVHYLPSVLFVHLSQQFHQGITARDVEDKRIAPNAALVFQLDV